MEHSPLMNSPKFSSINILIMLLHYFFMIISTSILPRTTIENINHTPKQNILFTKQWSYHTVLCFSVTYDFRHSQYAGGRSIASMIRLLLLLSGTEWNPGHTKYPCGEFNKPVRYERSKAINGTTKVVWKCVV